MSEILYWSAAAIASAIAKREISCRQAVDVFLVRIDEVNPAINAVVQLAATRAKGEANHLDKLAGKGELVGPLYGVSITVKDAIDTSGIVATGGTRGSRDVGP